MRTYCLEAKKYGDEKIPDGVNPRSITVILNATANRRKATKHFEKYCAPILHLAGICVDVLQTESEGHAKTLIDKLKNTDAIIIAGGDGTVSEVITGLFRQMNDDRILNPCPVGILPLGQTNSLGKVLFPGGESLATVKSLADASMAIVHQKIKLVDVMKVEVLENKEDLSKTSKNNSETAQNSKNDKESDVDSTKEKKLSENETKPMVEEDETPKPIYALATLEWGAFRDAYAKQDKYWYWGSLRKYATYIFSGYKSSLNWECNAEISYLEPCEGCSNCYITQKNTSKRWWARFWSRPQVTEKDYSKIKNERCGQQHTKEVITSDFTLKTANILGDKKPTLQLNLGPGEINYIDFVKEGFKTIKGENRQIENKIHARQLELLPKNISEKEIWFSIDKEEYEAMPIKITLLPRVLQVFCKVENS